jgi:prevent-host-death family protein
MKADDKLAVALWEADRHAAAALTDALPAVAAAARKGVVGRPRVGTSPGRPNLQALRLGGGCPPACLAAGDGASFQRNECFGKSEKGLYSVSFRSGSQAVRCSSRVKPISYLKANAAEVLAQLAEQREPLLITQNGEAKAVLQDVASFEETQEALALLKILALGNKDMAAGKVKPVAEVVTRLRAKRIAA